MPVSPFVAIGVGPDQGPFTLVSSSNPLPVTANAGTGTYIVAGTVLAGNVPSGGPVFMGGFDGTNVQNIRVDTSGRVVLSPTSSVTSLGGITTSTLSKFKKQGLAATVTAIKSSAAGNLYSLSVIGTDTANDMFIQLFDVATAGAVTLGTTVADWQFEIAKYTAGTLGVVNSINFVWPNGLPFANGLQIASTTTLDGLTGSAASKVDAYATFM